MTQTECPKCHSYKTTSASPRNAAINGGWSFIAMGGVLCFFVISMVIGIPLILLGAFMVLVGLTMPKTDEMKCANCSYSFKPTPVPAA